MATGGVQNSEAICSRRVMGRRSSSPSPSQLLSTSQFAAAASELCPPGARRKHAIERPPPNSETFLRNRGSSF